MYCFVSKLTICASYIVTGEFACHILSRFRYSSPHPRLPHLLLFPLNEALSIIRRLFYLHTGHKTGIHHSSSALLPNFLEPKLKREHHSLGVFPKPDVTGQVVSSFYLPGFGPDAMATQLSGTPFSGRSRPSLDLQDLANGLQCEFCGQVFSSVDACKRHKLKHQQSGFKHCCVLCLKKFYRKDALQSHLRKRHKLSI